MDATSDDAPDSASRLDALEATVAMLWPAVGDLRELLLTIAEMIDEAMTSP